jgi:hypothetical protein
MRNTWSVKCGIYYALKSIKNLRDLHTRCLQKRIKIQNVRFFCPYFNQNWNLLEIFVKVYHVEFKSDISSEVGAEIGHRRTDRRDLALR